MPERPTKIILTDWPKPKLIEAHLRGVETEELIEKLKWMYHFMMCFTTDRAGGYVIEYTPEGIKEELKFRNVEIPHGYE
jgi:hypothetical protein